MVPSSLCPSFTQARDGAVALLWNILEPPTVPEHSRIFRQRSGTRITEYFEAFSGLVGPIPHHTPTMGLLWMLALGGVFLAAAQACVFCRLPDRNLLGRVAQLCSQMEVHWKDCEASWNFSAFALGKTRHPRTGPAMVTPRVPSGAACGFSAVPLSSVNSLVWTHWSLPLGELLLTLGKSGKTPESCSGLMRDSLVIVRLHR